MNTQKFIEDPVGFSIDFDAFKRHVSSVFGGLSLALIIFKYYFFEGIHWYALFFLSMVGIILMNDVFGKYCRLRFPFNKTQALILPIYEMGFKFNHAIEANYLKKTTINSALFFCLHGAYLTALLFCDNRTNLNELSRSLYPSIAISILFFSTITLNKKLFFLETKQYVSELYYWGRFDRYREKFITKRPGLTKLLEYSWFITAVPLMILIITWLALFFIHQFGVDVYSWEIIKHTINTRESLLSFLNNEYSLSTHKMYLLVNVLIFTMNIVYFLYGARIVKDGVLIKGAIAEQIASQNWSVNNPSYLYFPLLITYDDLEKRVDGKDV